MAFVLPLPFPPQSNGFWMRSHHSPTHPHAPIFTMRLINVNSENVVEFLGDRIPRYAILSHTWGCEEVSFQDVQAGKASWKAGYAKIKHTCGQAKKDGFEWAWIDTCCVDKTSSAELSEAINSMYEWYAQSAVCYVFLEDVDILEDEDWEENPWQDRSEYFRNARWCTRGWTLQEVIAPDRVKFFDLSWKSIGPKRHLAEGISLHTQIPAELLRGTKQLQHYCAAQKMSWAASRTCTRVEDRAYSLMGLFGVNMPLLYGEGHRAFQRLQEEILKENDDQTILAWTVPASSTRAWNIESVFAQSPADFAAGHSMEGNVFDPGAPSTVTNRGLQISLPLVPRKYGLHSHLYIQNPECSVFEASLSASIHYETRKYLVRMVLIRTPQNSHWHARSANRYSRLATPDLIIAPLEDSEMSDLLSASLKPVYINTKPSGDEVARFGLGGIHLQDLPLAEEWCRQDPRRKTISNSDFGFFVRDIKLSTYNRVGGSLIESGCNLTWSTTFGCVLIQPDLFLANSVQLAQFEVSSTTLSETSFLISFGFNRSCLYFDVKCPGPHYPFNDSKIEHALLWVLHGDPRAVEWGSGTYGEIVSRRQCLKDVDVVATLLLEDPTTRDGEAAGNRTHFIITTRISPCGAADQCSRERRGEKRKAFPA
ncbi:HET-domain-containing protein [Xylariaceae sp. FL0804]|nr:HET-domain-containing protein [Xylariaceae sp. FL0804]